jgi:hypothetical protein
MGTAMTDTGTELHFLQSALSHLDGCAHFPRPRLSSLVIAVHCADWDMFCARPDSNPGAGVCLLPQRPTSFLAA